MQVAASSVAAVHPTTGAAHPAADALYADPTHPTGDAAHASVDAAAWTHATADAAHLTSPAPQSAAAAAGDAAHCSKGSWLGLGVWGLGFRV